MMPDKQNLEDILQQKRAEVESRRSGAKPEPEEKNMVLEPNDLIDPGTVETEEPTIVEGEEQLELAKTAIKLLTKEKQQLEKEVNGRDEIIQALNTELEEQKTKKPEPETEKKTVLIEVPEIISIIKG